MSIQKTAFADHSNGPPMMGSARTDAVTRAVASKLIRPTTQITNTRYGTRSSISGDPTSVLNRISTENSGRILSAKYAQELLPFIEICKSILVSSILSPKDLSTVELSFRARNKIITSEASTKMLGILKDHFESVHKLKDDLVPILENALFDTGSHPMLILAENTIDKIINGNSNVTLESFSNVLSIKEGRTQFRHIGFLGNCTDEAASNERSLGLEQYLSPPSTNSYDESARFLPHTLITDNPNILKLPAMRDRLRSDATNRLKQRINPSLSSESAADEAAQVIQSLYRSKSYNSELNIAMPTTGMSDRVTVGHPLVMKVPSESVIPVHEPSNPEKHLGYFILIDPTGSPIHKALEAEYGRNISGVYNNNASMIDNILRDASRINSGRDVQYNKNDVRELEQAYGELVEHELNQRLLRGIYGAGAKTACPPEVYRIMFGRALAGKMTQLLYVPEEMLVYFAFDYDKYGVGVSLLQKAMVLVGQLANLTLATTLAETRNAINRTKVGITLDEEDDDPSGTVEHCITEFAKLRRGSYPTTVMPPNDIINNLQAAGVEFEINGNTGYPNTKVDINEFTSQKAIPNLEHQKNLRDQLIWSFGIPPEVVDATRGADFATSVVNNHLLMTRGILRKQDALTPQLEKFVRTYTLSDGILMEKLRNVLKQAQSNPAVGELTSSSADAKAAIGGSDGGDIDRMIVDFLYDLEIGLPKPEGAKFENIKKAFEERLEFVKLAIDAWVSEGALSSELIGELGGQVNTLKEAWIALIMRDWCRDNGIAEAFDRLMEVGENKSPGLDLLAEIEAHSSPILINIRDFAIKKMRRAAADDKVLNAVKEQTGVSAGGGLDSTDTMSQGDDEGDIGGLDEFGGEMPVDTEEVTTDTTVTETTEETKTDTDTETDDNVES